MYPLNDSDCILRALTKRTWMQENRREAYILKRPQDIETLSISVNVERLTPDIGHWLLHSFNKSFGADRLRTVAIRNINIDSKTAGLDVQQSDHDLAERPDHASLTGLPHPNNIEMAERVATKHAAIAEALDREIRQRPD